MEHRYHHLNPEYSSCMPRHTTNSRMLTMEARMSPLHLHLLGLDPKTYLIRNLTLMRFKGKRRVLLMWQEVGSRALMCRQTTSYAWCLWWFGARGVRIVWEWSSYIIGMELSACAFYDTTENTTVQTMKVAGVINNYPVKILLDSGSTHNVVDS